MIYLEVWPPISLYLRRQKNLFMLLPPSWSKALFTITLENSLPPRNEEVTDEGHEAFKVKESVNFIIRAFDPAKDALKDKLEIDNNNHNDKGITQQD